jgi:alpha-L-rhamnosidase
MDLVAPENKQAVLNNLVADIEAHGNRLTTGDVGNRYLFQALAENDLNEVMYKMLNHYEAPGYGYQLQYGLTTLTEQWDPAKGNSWNHFMMGQIEEWFFKSILGIVADLEQPGFKHFYIQPSLFGDMSFAKGSVESLYGEIVVDWKRSETDFQIDVTVPVNSTATFVLPKQIASKETKIELESGKHSFHYTLNERK